MISTGAKVPISKEVMTSTTLTSAALSFLCCNLPSSLPSRRLQHLCKREHILADTEILADELVNSVTISVSSTVDRTSEV
jgi:hypothetical protein